MNQLRSGSIAGRSGGIARCDGAVHAGQVGFLPSSLRPVMKPSELVASIVIEGFIAALRPLSVCPQVCDAELPRTVSRLVRLAHTSLGRHKGTSAHACVTGTPVEDWPTLLGYPPSDSSLQFEQRRLAHVSGKLFQVGGIERQGHKILTQQFCDEKRLISVALPLCWFPVIAS